VKTRRQLEKLAIVTRKIARRRACLCRIPILRDVTRAARVQYRDMLLLLNDTSRSSPYACISLLPIEPTRHEGRGVLEERYCSAVHTNGL